MARNFPTASGMFSRVWYSGRSVSVLMSETTTGFGPGVRPAVAE